MELILKKKFEINDNDFNFSNINRHFLMADKSKSNKIQKYFYWKYARKSWGNVERPVFLDFGGDKLFWVKEGMGTSSGNGIYVSKENFINKYGGDYEYHCQQFLNNPANEKA